jgi:hypothetical protein
LRHQYNANDDERVRTPVAEFLGRFFSLSRIRETSTRWLGLSLSEGRPGTEAIMRRRVFFWLCFALLGSALALGESGVYRHDTYQDRRDLRHDRHDRRQDWRDIHRDRRDIRKDRRDLRNDLRNGNYADARRDRRDIRKDARDLRNDRRDVRADGRDFRHDRRDIRSDYYGF